MRCVCVGISGPGSVQLCKPNSGRRLLSHICTPHTPKKPRRAAPGVGLTIEAKPRGPKGPSIDCTPAALSLGATFVSSCDGLNRPRGALGLFWGGVGRWYEPTRVKLIECQLSVSSGLRRVYVALARRRRRPSQNVQGLVEWMATAWLTHTSQIPSISFDRQVWAQLDLAAAFGGGPTPRPSLRTFTSRAPRPGPTQPPQKAMAAATVASPALAPAAAATRASPSFQWDLDIHKSALDGDLERFQWHVTLEPALLEARGFNGCVRFFPDNARSFNSYSIQAQPIIPTQQRPPRALRRPQGRRAGAALPRGPRGGPPRARQRGLDRPPPRRGERRGAH